jgi:hypothetical protein
VCLFNCLVLSSDAFRMVAPRIAALDAAIKVKSLPVMPSKTSLQKRSAKLSASLPVCATYILALSVLKGVVVVVVVDWCELPSACVPTSELRQAGGNAHLELQPERTDTTHHQRPGLPAWSKEPRPTLADQPQPTGADCGGTVSGCFSTDAGAASKFLSGSRKKVPEAGKGKAKSADDSADGQHNRPQPPQCRPFSRHQEPRRRGSAQR